MPDQEKTPDPGGNPDPQHLTSRNNNNNDQTTQSPTNNNNQSASPQSTGNRNAFIIKRLNDIRYEEDATGPFMVAISKPGIGNKHPTLIGEFLYKSKISGLKTIQRINKDLIHIELVTREQANNFLNDDNNTLPYENVKCFLPLKFTTKRLIVNNVHSDLEIESIGQYLKEKYKRIISVRRIFRKNDDGALIPTEKLDILWEGTTRPDYLYIFYSRCATSPYIYSTVYCTNCLNYGHRAFFKDSLICKSQSRCNKCSETHAGQDICPNNLKCFHCKGNHQTFSPTCPEMHKQKLIKKCMATYDLNFKAAQKLLNTYQKDSIVNLTGRIEEIQKNIRTVESNNIENIQSLANFPELKNKFVNLIDINAMEIDNYQYSMKDLTRPYSEIVASPSPTRKKPKTNSFEDELPSKAWLDNYRASLKEAPQAILNKTAKPKEISNSRNPSMQQTKINNPNRQSNLTQVPSNSNKPTSQQCSVTNSPPTNSSSKITNHPNNLNISIPKTNSVSTPNNTLKPK